LSRTVVAALIAAFAVLWLVPSPYYERLNNPNENVRVYLTRAIVEHQTLAIDDIIDEWGNVDDKAQFEGRMYPGKAPGLSLLAVPIYAAYHAACEKMEYEPSRREIVYVCRLGTVVLPCLFFLWWFVRFTARLTDDIGSRLLCIFAVGGASTMLVYGMIFTSHTLMSWCVMGAYMAGVAYRDDRHPSWVKAAWLAFVVGHLLGWAVSLEYPGFLGAAVVGLHAIYRSENKLAFMGWSAAGAAVSIGILMAYHHFAFGGIFQTAYQHLENPQYAEYVSGGFFGMKRISTEALWGSFFAPSNGLFWFMPWTLLAVVALPALIRNRSTRDEAIMVAVILVLYTLFISMVRDWRGGWTAGPRYIVPVVPFLGLLLLRVDEALSRTGSAVLYRTLIVASLGLGSFACGLSAAMYPHYPSVLDNPVFELGVRFVAAGYWPHTSLAGVGLSGSMALLIVAIAHVVLLGLVAVHTRETNELSRGAILVGALAACLVATSAASRVATDTPALRRTMQTVHAAWEPAQNSVEQRLRVGQVPTVAQGENPNPLVLRAAARQAANAGYSDTAFVWILRALDQAHIDARATRRTTAIDP
jgi:hypothetical protein